MFRHQGISTFAAVILLTVLSPSAGQVLVAPGQPGQVVQHPVYVEDSPAALELGLEAMDLAGQGRYADAAQKLQAMIDDYPHKLMATGETTYTDALLWARATLLKDEQLLGAYRSLYAPAAEREVSLALASGDRPLDADALRQVLTRYTQTTAGLEAGLALAAYHLERAEAADASGVLDELSGHPDLDAHAGRYHFLRAVAAMLTDDTPGHDVHLLALRELSDDVRLAELDAFANRIHPPLRLKPGQRPARVDDSDLPQDLDEPLWDIDLLDQVVQVAGRPGMRGLPADRAPLRVIPACGEEKVFVNRGERISAYDRASGWQIWEVLDRPDVLTDPRVYTPGRALLTEPRGVYIEGNRVYGLLGWMNPGRNIQQAQTDGVSLVAVHVEDGKELWRVLPDELDPVLEDSAFDGTPLGGSGRLYALVKRVRTSGLHDLYLVALRQADGGLIWRRHLSSSSSQTHYNALPSARMLLRAGRIYVSDNRGTAYALDGQTGTVRWVTMLPDVGDAAPVSRRYTFSAKDPSAPVHVRAGLLVPPIKEGGPYLLLDADSGGVLRALEGPGWSGVESCYTAGGDVLGFSDGVTCFDGRTLEPLWRCDLDEASKGKPRGRPAIRSWDSSDGETPRGVVVFSTDKRLIALSLSDGRVTADHAIDAPGHIVLAPGQVFLAATDELNAYTDWADAHRQIRFRADGNPADPQPGMALARLAMRTGRDDAVLEGVDLALAALKSPDQPGARDDTPQARVFLMLRALTDPANGAAVALRGELLDRMAVSTSTTGQEAAYQLTRGLYQQECEEPHRAVEHFQAVLADRAMSSELYKVGRGSRRAGLEAKRLLEALIANYGREVYQPYDLLAEHELADLQSHAENDPQRYADLAERYPLALCVNQARRIAADLSIDAGEPAKALRQLQAVYLNTDPLDGLAEVAGRIAQLHLQQQKPGLARRWLRRVEREHPGLVLVRDDQPVSTGAWLSELDYMLSATRLLPGLEPPLSEPAWIDGRPVPIENDLDELVSRQGRVLMSDGKAVWLLAAPKLNEIWRRPMPAEDARVLLHDDRQVLWWSKQSSRLWAWDTRTGEPLWPGIDCKQALDEAGDPQLRFEQRTREQRTFIQLLGGVRRPSLITTPSDEDVMTAVDLATVLIADNLGRAVCIDRQSGAVRWRTLSASDSVTAIALGDDLVALGGASWADTEAQHGIVTLLDTLTGEPLAIQVQSEDVPSWLGFADNGFLVTKSQGRLTGYDPATGRTQWHSQLPRTAGVDRVDLGGRLLVVSNHRTRAGSTSVGSVMVLDVDSGELANQLPFRTAAGQASMFDAVESQGQWYTLTPMRAVALNASGRTLWSDAVCAPIGQLLMQRVGRESVCILGLERMTQGVQLPGGAPEVELALRGHIAAGRISIAVGSYRLYLLDRATGKIVSDTPLSDLPARIDPLSAVLTDGALMLGVGDRTLVIRGLAD